MATQHQRTASKPIDMRRDDRSKPPPRTSQRSNPNRDSRPHRLGRPRKAPDELRTEDVRARLSIAEKLKLTADAERCGMSEAAYIRSLIAGHTPQAAGRSDPRLLNELNAVGNNLNQAVRDMHAGRRQKQDWETVRKQLVDVLERVALAELNDDPRRESRDVR